MPIGNTRLLSLIVYVIFCNWSIFMDSHEKLRGYRLELSVMAVLTLNLFQAFLPQLIEAVEAEYDLDDVTPSESARSSTTQFTPNIVPTAASEENDIHIDNSIDAEVLKMALTFY